MVLACAFLLTTATVVFSQSHLVFPQIVLGSGYETILQIMNEVETDNTVHVELRSGNLTLFNGDPLWAQFNGTASSPSGTFSLAPFQELSVTLTRPDATTELLNGWAYVHSSTSGGKISASLIYRQKSNGRLLHSIGVAGARPFRYAVIQADHQESGIDTGIAFVNPYNVTLTVSIELFQAKQKIGSYSQTLGAYQHFARLVSELFPLFKNAQGTVVIEAAANHAVPILALRMEQGQYASIPVRPLGFVFRYEIYDRLDSPLKQGLWMFDFEDFNLTGIGRDDQDPVESFYSARGHWIDRTFQFSYLTTFQDGSRGVVIFNGISQGAESTLEKKITGKVTTLAADGSVVSVHNFSAFHRFGSPPE